MSRLGSSSDEPRGVLVRKPQANIYTVLLGITLLALVLSSLLLVLEFFRYGLQFRPPADLRNAAVAVPTAHLLT